MTPAIVAVALALGPVIGGLLKPAGAAASEVTPATSPLPASNYRVRDLCLAPGPGRASCRAQALLAVTTAARAHLHPLGVTHSAPLAAPSPSEGAYGFRPEDLKAAYFPGESAGSATSEGQTIALIEAYNDIEAQADLQAYGEAFTTKLPKLKSCGSPAIPEPACFEKVNQKGETGKLPFPQSTTELKEAREFCKTRDESESLAEWEEKEAVCEQVEEAAGWSLETSLDIEMAHATCQNCRIVLVEANSPTNANLDKAEDEAAEKLGATEISNSWGGEELANDSAFDHEHIVITAAAGDNGYLNWTEAEEARTQRRPYYSGAEYPASSPHVVAVGGTSLNLNKGTGQWQSETVWNDDNSLENLGAGGSGCSSDFTAPPWQQALPNWPAVGCEGRRAVADVSADADPYTGVAVYDSEINCESIFEEAEYVARTPWCTLGGTSVGTPLIAAMYALAGGANGVAYPAETLYKHLETDLLHPVTGSNGECDGDYSTGCTGAMEPSSPRFAFDCGQGVLICNAAAGCAGDYYAGPTGVGSPNGIGAFRPEEHAAKDGATCETQSVSGDGSSGGNTGDSGSDPPAPESIRTLTETGSATPPKSPSASGTTPLTAVISDLALAKAAKAALHSRHPGPYASQLAIAFTLNIAARVRVTLARRITVHGHDRWHALPYALTFAAHQGHNTAHLSARRRLDPGSYRLTVTPVGGRARTLTFLVG